MGDADNRFSNPIRDVTRRITEFGFGWEITKCLGRASVTGSVGTEWQFWSNYVGGRAFLNETEDVGFDALVLALAVDF